ncbi:hypothetical protein [Tunturiibacter gelidiferens]|uniref:hypothetical protein n=1 Tax=Tunturiibacter gelidiferens TaxID=3069689 RepID=UPI003D9B79CF
MNLRAAKHDVSSQFIQTWLFFLRNETKVTKFQVKQLTARNEHSKEPVVAPGGPVVSVTTYGERLGTVHLALESIAAGSALPSRLILWVDSAEGFANRSAGLKRLVDRGLEIYLTDNFGPHTKYYPYLLSTDTFDVPLVTADDDLLYSRWWLEGLVRSHRERPEEVHCYRAHRIGLANGVITPYQTWEPCRSAEADYLHFGTGVSGCIYPMSLLKRLKLAGAEFMQLCPKADDVWLHVNALRAGMKTSQIWNRPLRFPFVPETQGSGLYHSNVLLARNDEQIRSTYTAKDIAVLEAESSLHRR